MADMVPKKEFTFKVNISWEQFTAQFAAELTNLSTGILAIMYYAGKSRKDVKIKKKGEELSAFFARVEAR